MELCPFWLVINTRWSMWDVYFVSFWRIFLTRDVNQLKDERSSCDDAASTRKEISTDDILEY